MTAFKQAIADRSLTLWRNLTQTLGKVRVPSHPTSAASAGNQIEWLGGEVWQSVCPLCFCAENQTAFVEIVLGETARRLLGEAKITLVRCPACQVRYASPGCSVSYTEADRSALKFYLEQGAGIRSMLEPLQLADARPVARYLEIGCSYGFSMDYARRVLGWDVRGFDPGGLALAGKDQLGLPIENGYLDASAATGDFDLVFCSEVIEHIPDPQQYMGLMRRSLSSGGLALLTTPDGDCLRPDMPAEALLPIISPGHHVILYNARSLEFLLRQSGFTHTRLEQNGNQLRAAASDVPFSGSAVYFTAARYRDYLTQAVAQRPADDILYGGLVYRLLKEETNGGRFGEAQRWYDVLRDLYRDRYRIDIDNPAALVFQFPGAASFDEFGRRWPYNLAGIWYCRGIIQLIEERRPRDAAPTLMAAISFGEALRNQLRSIGTDDLETAQLCREAEIARISALAQFDAERALDAVFALRPGLDGPNSTRFRAHAQRARARLFADLINCGHHALAERLLETGPAPIDEAMRADDLAAICAWGIYLLTEKGRHVEAGRVFRRLWQAARESGRHNDLLWTARFHQGLAALYIGETDKAHEVAYEIAHPPPDWGSVPGHIACRIDELSKAGT
ncbi:MAG: class I SAM-dependent methyltransferase [Alphaproteobacteria bacterium]|nr:class I SAM-dependent methyltransferase [Alphaproteobacteria bacterium]